jgi:hypothetical protein
VSILWGIRRHLLLLLLPVQRALSYETQATGSTRLHLMPLRDADIGASQPAFS